MATLVKPARVLGITGCLGDLDIINTPSMINSNWFLSNMSSSGWKFVPLLIFILLNLSFIILLIHRVTLALDISLDEEDEMEEDLASEEGEEYITGEEGEGST
jgi:hypothetical protein